MAGLVCGQRGRVHGTWVGGWSGASGGGEGNGGSVGRLVFKALAHSDGGGKGKGATWTWVLRSCRNILPLFSSFLHVVFAAAVYRLVDCWCPLTDALHVAWVLAYGGKGHTDGLKSVAIGLLWQSKNRRWAIRAQQCHHHAGQLVVRPEQSIQTHGSIHPDHCLRGMSSRAEPEHHPFVKRRETGK
jgi:hypothetical protein